MGPLPLHGTGVGSLQRRVGARGELVSHIFFNSVKTILLLSALHSREAYGPTFGGQHEQQINVLDKCYIVLL